MRPARRAARVEERVVGQAVEQGRLLHNLEDRVLDGRCVRSGQGEEVEGYDRDPVRELFCWGSDQASSVVCSNSTQTQGEKEREERYAPTYFLAEYSE